MIKRLTHNWIPKLVSIALAVVAWYFISLNVATTSQRNLAIPVSIVGLEQNQTISEIIDKVNITVSGESRQVNRLVPENFSATLNVAGLNGEYEKKIEVIPPQGIQVDSVSPEISIGTIETISSKEVPVSILFLPGQDPNFILSAQSSQQTIIAQGRESILNKVTQVAGLITPQTGETTVNLFATDATFSPIGSPSDISLQPSTIKVNVTAEPILHTKPVVLSVDMPALDGFSIRNLELSQSVVTLVGPQAALENLEQITGSVLLPISLEATSYNVPVNLVLPENISSLQTITAQFSLEALNPLAPQQ